MLLGFMPMCVIPTGIGVGRRSRCISRRKQGLDVSAYRLRQTAVSNAFSVPTVNLGLLVSFLVIAHQNLSTNEALQIDASAHASADTNNSMRRLRLISILIRLEHFSI